MKRLFFVMICVCGGLSAVTEQISSDSKCPCSVKPKINKDEVQTIIHDQTIQVDEAKCNCHKPPHKDDVQEAKCGCSVKPPHKDETQDVKCPCSVKPPHKDDVQVDAAKCGCSVKPPHKDDTQDVKCPCQKPPHKETTGADLFVSGTQGIMLCVQGGVLAQKEGNIKVALPYIFEGLSILTDLASRSPNPEKSYQDLFKFMNSLDKNELDILAKKAIK